MSDNIFSRLQQYEQSGMAKLRAFKERQRRKEIEREARRQQHLVERLGELKKQREEVGRRAQMTGEEMRIKEDIAKEKKFIESQKPHYFRKGLKYAGKGALWGGKLAFEGARAVIRTPKGGQGYQGIPRERYVPKYKEPKAGFFDWDKGYKKEVKKTFYPRKGYRQKQFAKKQGFFDWDKGKKGPKRGFLDW